jgi:outer membrane protein assembly factor BamB
MPFLFFTIASLLCFISVGAPLAGDHGEKLKWRWAKEKASLAYSIKQHLQDYDVELVKDKEYLTPINIRSKKSRRIVYLFKDGHDNTVFTRLHDTLFVAEYCAIASGCEVVSVDLKTGKQLWKSRLQGIGPTRHSKYRNLVNIETDGKYIIVNGNEAHGRYVELLDIKTGQTLANKKLKADPDSLLK